MKSKLIALTLLVIVGIFPALAQGSVTNTVQYNGFGFSFDSTIATNVDISQYAGDSPDVQQPGGPEPHYIQFNLYTRNPAPEAGFDAPISVRVYSLADVAAYPDSIAQVQVLQNLVAQRPDLASYMTVNSDNTASNALPFLPVMPASQVIRARAQYVETPVLKGVSYVTVYRQDVSPFINNEFRYIFQGLSNDGLYYVSVIFQITAPDFPAEIPADFDYDTFSKEFVDYLTESVGKLNAAAPDTFAPSLTLLDTLTQSFTIDNAAISNGGSGTVVAEPTASDPTLSGLANTVWSLVSYGPVDAQTPAVAGIPVTATFSEQGVAGSGGCNGYSGPFQYNAGAISFGALISTKMACEDPVMSQETAFFNALSSASTYAIIDGQLRITYDGGVLTFAGVVPTA
ncbi:MAG: META domain-containing protein [Chloroflexota bacterium]